MPDAADTSDADPLALAGVTVVITRPIERAGALVDLFAARGAATIVMPLIEVVDLATPAEIDAVLAPLTADDWVVVASGRAATRVAVSLDRSPARVAAMGATTASTLSRADLVPVVQNAEGLVAAFPSPSTQGGRVVVAQSGSGERTLVAGLTTLGWNVRRLDTHFSRAVVPTVQQQRAVMQADVVVFTSGSQAAAWVEVFGTATPAVVATMGPQTARNAESCGLKVDVVAADHSLPGVVRAVQGFVKP